MGIKFYCPNGHKLNVKGFLAGKRAICPKCGVKVVVPGDAGSQSDVLDPDELAELTSAHAGDRSNIATGANSTLSAAAVDAAVAGAIANGPATDPIDEDPTARELQDHCRAAHERVPHGGFIAHRTGYREP